jgi:DNA polymerase
MTQEAAEALIRFLDITGDYLRDGYRGPPREYVFSGASPAPEEAEEGEPRPPDRDRPPGATMPPPPQEALETLTAQIRACTACPLCKTRIQAVPGEGVSRPLAVIIGEGPGADEDASGRPFVGKAGQLLDRMLASIGLFRHANCYIANVVKCRPPDNRDPLPDEIAACAPFLTRQIDLLTPRLILSVGRVSAGFLLNTDEKIGTLRGRFADYRGIPLLPTYHPSALLRNEALKRPAWEDLKIFKAKLAALDEPHVLESGKTLEGADR